MDDRFRAVDDRRSTAEKLAEDAALTHLPGKRQFPTLSGLSDCRVCHPIAAGYLPTETAPQL